MSKPRPFRISRETATGSEDLGELAAADHSASLLEALRRWTASCPDERCDIVATDPDGRERRVELDPFDWDFRLALHAPDRYLRERAADLDMPPICERAAELGWER